MNFTGQLIIELKKHKEQKGNTQRDGQRRWDGGVLPHIGIISPLKIPDVFQLFI